MVRLTPKGALDTTYGESGIVTLEGTANTCFYVAAQSDGKVVLQIIDDAGERKYSLARLLPQKAGASFLDSTFGQGGTVALSDVADTYSFTIDGHDRTILTGGLAVDGGTSPSLLRRYTTTGQVDTSFAVDGTVKAFFINHAFFGKSDSVYVDYTDPDTSKYGFYRLDDTGKLDTTWGSGGRIPLKAHEMPDYKEPVVVSATVDSADNVIVVANAGTTDDKGGISLVGRMTKNAFDPSWADGNYQFLYGESATDQMLLTNAVAEPNGAVLLTGYRSTFESPPKTQLYVARFTANGQYDSSFGDGASSLPGVTRLSPDVASELIRPYGIALQPERVAVAYGLGNASKVLRLWR